MSDEQNPEFLTELIANKLPTNLNRQWANELLDAIPEGWCKVRGQWMRLEEAGAQWTCSDRCWQEGGPHDDGCTKEQHYRVRP